ncbi:Xylanase regulator [Hyphodiscus hymeniophilus]|uniref:Xylanase regulator n=1 Tax=Hyphodiscus hymeniophilus TaxID=353542 RepID=A0A9P6VDH8_9HELO|nr:Xylanase regulator [Hyphodiscus hymeniophilus]
METDIDMRWSDDGNGSPGLSANNHSSENIHAGTAGTEDQVQGPTDAPATTIDTHEITDAYSSGRHQEPNQESYLTTHNAALDPTNAAGATPSALDIVLDDYQMFNDPSWSLPDFGGDFEQYIGGSLPGTTNALESPRTSGEPGLPGKLRPVVETSEPDTGQQETYGIHSFRSVKENNQLGTTKDIDIRRSSIDAFNIRKSAVLSGFQRDAEITEEQQHEALQAVKLPQEVKIPNIQLPVLRDVIHLLRPFIPDSLSYDLLEAYFKVSTVTNAYLAPCAPPLVYRRCSFLRLEEPRRSSHVLLVSMLWLSAQTADIPLLTASIARRKYVRRKLLELTTKLLKPLNEVSLDNDLPLQHTTSSSNHNPDGSGGHKLIKSHVGLNDSIDEIMAYVHLAMVTSASEFKGASLRWWNIAFSLAREAKLNQEIPSASVGIVSNTDYDDTMVRSSLDEDHHIFASQISEEGREERRRVFWFLYTMDRHLSLSYNKPLALLDSDCQGLYRPSDDGIWQGDQIVEVPQPLEAKAGPYFACQGPTFFGFFTPLAALLGEIVYFVGAQNHPRFGVSQRTLLDWKEWEKGIADRLDEYVLSLERLLHLDTTVCNAQEAHSNLHQNILTESSNYLSEVETRERPIPFQSRVAYAYAKIIIHVLHVLLAGKWDALALLDESNAWHSSPAFITTISHVVEAAKSAEVLLDLDPDAHFMPFFLGIYLFQGSIPLVVAAERLKTDAADIVIRACDTMIRVHEAYVIRMPSEYQILLVSVLRVGLKKMQGRPLYDAGDFAKRQVQVCERYSWAREGRGLAG